MFKRIPYLYRLYVYRHHTNKINEMGTADDILTINYKFVFEHMKNHDKWIELVKHGPHFGKFIKRK